MNTILIFEPDFLFLDFLVELLNEQGFITLASPNEQLSLQLAENHNPNLIIWDITKTDFNNHKSWRALFKSTVKREIPCIFLTPEATDINSLDLSELKADDCLDESCTVQELLAAIEMQLTRTKQVA